MAQLSVTFYCYVDVVWTFSLIHLHHGDLSGLLAPSCRSKSMLFTRNLTYCWFLCGRFFFSVPCSDKSTFVSHMSAFFCRYAEWLNVSAKLQTLRSKKVCMSVRGNCCLRPAKLELLSELFPSAVACPLLFQNKLHQKEKFKPSKSSQTQGLLCSREKRGWMDRKKIRFKANLLSLYQGTDWPGFVCVLKGLWLVTL